MNRRTWVGATVAVVGLTIAGCGNDAESDSSPSESVGHSHAGSDLEAPTGATEVETAQPRLVVTDSKSGTVDVVDLTSTEVLKRIDLGDTSKVTMIDKRYAFAVDGEGGRVTVIDAGSWIVDHGDHTHSYVSDPKEIGELSGQKPAHIVPGDDRVASFFDDDGAAQVLDIDSLGEGNVDITATIKADKPHHGVVVPLAGHYITSHSVADPEDARPGSFELRDSDGDKVQDFQTPCPRMHGEAGFEDYMLGACDDGVFKASVKDGKWSSEKIPYSDGIDDTTRPTTFREQQGVGRVVATAGPAATNDGVLVLDSATGQWKHITTPDKAINVNISGDGRSVFAILADGTFHVYDASTGAETGASKALAEPYNWSDKTATPPVIVVGGNRAYVSDPDARVVQEIDYADNARVARTIEVGVSASSLGIAGL
ncbi:ABC transporter [Gordonia humi]|uniref:ABC transporter n=1 Tax=Gordonia humi TaxID=686429 RepID=A0A840EU30_9ACTN|nr:ABC transporter [Gordonia humi]MBB4135081.1 hypothetical protein [Gordonia humi]